MLWLVSGIFDCNVPGLSSWVKRGACYWVKSLAWKKKQSVKIKKKD